MCKTVSERHSYHVASSLVLGSACRRWSTATSSAAFDLNNETQGLESLKATFDLK